MVILRSMNRGTGEDGRAHHTILPVSDREFVQAFCRSFSLDRTGTGLSIVVPYVRSEVTLNSLATAVIEQYFLPIIAGRLEIEVCENRNRITISRATISDVIDQLSWPAAGTSSKQEMSALIDLARWQVDLRPEEYVSMNPIGPEPPYEISRDHFPDTTIQRVADEYALNHRVALRIPVRIRPTGQGVEEDHVRVILEHDDTLRVSNVPHLRSGINVSRMRSAGERGVRGLLIVGNELETQGALDKLLQASEGPAHINWELRGEGYDKAKSLFPDAYKVISFMRHLVGNLVGLLAAPQDNRDLRTA